MSYFSFGVGVKNNSGNFSETEDEREVQANEPVEESTESKEEGER